MVCKQELRAGNLVKSKIFNKVVSVIEIHKLWIETDHSPIGYLEFDKIEPIPISEEILLKCGFEVKPFSLGLTLDRFRFIWKTEYKYWYVVDAYSQSYLTKIEFVHELQNFIFVMNGQELNTSGL